MLNYYKKKYQYCSALSGCRTLETPYFCAFRSVFKVSWENNVFIKTSLEEQVFQKLLAFFAGNDFRIFIPKSLNDSIKFAENRNTISFISNEVIIERLTETLPKITSGPLFLRKLETQKDAKILFETLADGFEIPEKHKVDTISPNFTLCKKFLNLYLLESTETNASLGGILAAVDSRTIYIEALAIRKAFQNQGLGRHMVQLLIEKTKNLGIKNITLNCSEEAFPFYQKHNFKINSEYKLFSVKK